MRKTKRERRNEMQKSRYFEKYTSRGIFKIMKSMLNAEFCTYFGAIREDDYEWVIGADVWVRIASNINDFDISWSDTNEEPICKIFDIEVTISTNELNTITLRKKDITLRKKDERGNEIPVEKKSTIRYNCHTSVSASSISVPAIKKVIFNYPATIVLWSDGSKTVVKCQDGEIYDPEKGLAMAISKKALGNKGDYCEVFKKWLPEDEEDVAEFRFDSSDFEARINSLINSINSHFPLKKEDLTKKDE